MISHMVSAEEESRVCKEDRYVWEIGNLNGMATGSHWCEIWGRAWGSGGTGRDVWKEGDPGRVSNKSKGPEAGVWLGCYTHFWGCETNHRKRAGLKCTFSLLKFWRAESKITFTGLKSRCLQGCAPSWGREESVFCSFQLLVAVRISRLWPHHFNFFSMVTLFFPPCLWTLSTSIL